MKTNLIVAALLCSVNAFPTQTIVRTDALTCSKCVAGGYNWCSETAEYGLYKTIDTIANYPANTSGLTSRKMNCCDPASATCGTAFDATATNNPALSSFTCIGVTDSSVGLAMCPFVEEVCGSTKEYSAALS